MNKWPYNTRRWQALRRLVLSCEPCCRYCAEQGRITPATDVDHIVPISRDRAMVFDLSNLQPLCHGCHSGPKQSEERTGRRCGCDILGIPLRGWK